jgi:hypothetical protein
MIMNDKRLVIRFRKHILNLTEEEEMMHRYLAVEDATTAWVNEDEVPDGEGSVSVKAIRNQGSPIHQNKTVKKQESDSAMQLQLNQKYDPSEKEKDNGIVTEIGGCRRLEPS